MTVAFPDCYDCENASSINGELWCSLFFHPCSQTIACSRNAPKPKPKTVTNADRIRTMSDEELADKFEEIQLKTVKAYGNDDLLLKGELKKYWLDWLKEEADHD